MKLNKKEYENFLNDLSPAYESDDWIIGGKKRIVLAAKRKFGTATRVYDPIGFEVGFKDWKSNYKNHD